MPGAGRINGIWTACGRSRAPSRRTKPPGDIMCVELRPSAPGARWRRPYAVGRWPRCVVGLLPGTRRSGSPGSWAWMRTCCARGSAPMTHPSRGWLRPRRPRRRRSDARASRSLPRSRVACGITSPSSGPGSERHPCWRDSPMPRTAPARSWHGASAASARHAPQLRRHRLRLDGAGLGLGGGCLAARAAHRGYLSPMCSTCGISPPGTWWSPARCCMPTPRPSADTSGASMTSALRRSCSRPTTDPSSSATVHGR